MRTFNARKQEMPVPSRSTRGQSWWLGLKAKKRHPEAQAGLGSMGMEATPAEPAAETLQARAGFCHLEGSSSLWELIKLPLAMGAPKDSIKTSNLPPLQHLHKLFPEGCKHCTRTSRSAGLAGQLEILKGCLLSAVFGDVPKPEKQEVFLGQPLNSKTYYTFQRSCIEDSASTIAMVRAGQENNLQKSN